MIVNVAYETAGRMKKTPEFGLRQQKTASDALSRA
jgi:hypothetical protein